MICQRIILLIDPIDRPKFDTNFKCPIGYDIMVTMALLIPILYTNCQWRIQVCFFRVQLKPPSESQTEVSGRLSTHSLHG